MNDKELTIKHLKLLRDGIKEANERFKLKFDMEHYSITKFDTRKLINLNPHTVVNGCNTSCCALGHAVFIESIPKPAEGEIWEEYSSRIFPTFSCPNNGYWGFLFGVLNPNCIDAFIKRANKIIKELE